MSSSMRFFIVIHLFICSPEHKVQDHHRIQTQTANRESNTIYLAYLTLFHHFVIHQSHFSSINHTFQSLIIIQQILSFLNNFSLTLPGCITKLICISPPYSYFFSTKQIIEVKNIYLVEKRLFFKKYKYKF